MVTFMLTTAGILESITLLSCGVNTNFYIGMDGHCMINGLDRSLNKCV